MVDPIGTCQALDLLTQDQIEQLFDDQNGYLSKVDEIFDTVQIHEMQKNEKNKNNQSSDDDNITSIDDIKPKKKKKKHRRTSSIITSKKCLILDVDNTLIYVRHFMDEMRVGDHVKLGDKDANVIKITYRLDLEFSDNPGQMSAYDHHLTKKDVPIPQRGEWFPDEQTKVAIIHQADPTGCVIKLKTNNNNNNNNNTAKKPVLNGNTTTTATATDDNKPNKQNDADTDVIAISFLQNSDELSQLEPMMSRDDYLSVTFMYGGYLVRIRPGLGEFLSRCNQKYDVILFTAADGSVYQGLLKQVHHILKQELNELKSNPSSSLDYIIPNKLWCQVYFRSDCDEKYDEYGLPYRHKNLAKLGRELSTIVMVDDNPLSYRGFEPNSVRVAGFWGLSHPQDKELLHTLFPTLHTIADHKDVRYHLSGLGSPPDDVQSTNILDILARKTNNDNDDNTSKDNDNDNKDDDLLLRQRRHSRQASAKFLGHLKEAILAENEESDDTDDDDDDDNNTGSQESKQSVTDDNTSTDDESTDDNDDNASVDSLSADKIQQIEELEKQNDNKIKQLPSVIVNNNPNPNATNDNNNASDIFDDNFDDVAQDVVNKYASMPNSDDEKSNISDMSNTNPQNDDQQQQQQQQQQQNSITPHTRNISESDGTTGVMIYDNYDADILFRDAYDSPKAAAVVPDIAGLQKRPSIELRLDKDNNKNTNNNQLTVNNAFSDHSRPSNPVTPSNDTEPSSNDEPVAQIQSRRSYNIDDDDDDDDNDDNNVNESDDDNVDIGADFVLTPPNPIDQSKSISTSSTKRVDTGLLNKNYTNYYDDNKDQTPKHLDGFISIEDMNNMNMTKTRPSRTPTPIADHEASILIEKTSGCSGCSCFGWFGSRKRKKKNKNNTIGLAEQELR